MKAVALLLNDMVVRGVLKDYALFGALAQMRYTEAVATFDADVLVAVEDETRLDVLSPVYRDLESRGYRPEGDAVRVGDWPVRFIPVFDALSRAALEQAQTVDYEGVPLRVVSALFLALMALKTGRAKDGLRLLALLDAGAVTRRELASKVVLFDLSAAWKRFEERFGDEPS